MKYTPDFIFLQALENQKYDRTRVRYSKIAEHGFAERISSSYSPVRNPQGKLTLRMTFKGRYVQAKLINQTKQPPTRTARGKITDFSKGSRGRLFDLFNQLELKTNATFITLTYPETTTNAETAKNHLLAYIKRIQRKFNFNPVGVWRMEFQERGAIHFHLVLFKCRFIPKEEIQTLWGEVTNTYRPFTRIEKIYSHNKLINYVAKYVGKVNPSTDTNGFNLLTYLAAYQAEHGENIGRVWGYFNKKSLPYAPEEIIELPFNYANFMRFRRVAVGVYPPLENSLSWGFRLYVDDAVKWWRIFHYIYDIKF